MLFFRTISLVAALAFATLTSAVPFEGAGLVTSGDVIARDSSAITDLFNNCNQNVQVIIVNLKIAVENDNHGVILDCLNQINSEITATLIPGVQGYGSDSVEVDDYVLARIFFDLLKTIVTNIADLFDTSDDITACIKSIGINFDNLLDITITVVVNVDFKNVFIDLCAPLVHNYFSFLLKIGLSILFKL